MVFVICLSYRVLRGFIFGVMFWMFEWCESSMSSWPRAHWGKRPGARCSFPKCPTRVMFSRTTHRPGQVVWGWGLGVGGSGRAAGRSLWSLLGIEGGGSGLGGDRRGASEGDSQRGVAERRWAMVGGDGGARGATVAHTERSRQCLAHVRIT